MTTCATPVTHVWCLRYITYVEFCFAAILREESSQTNVILQYKLLAAILIAVCNVIQQSIVLILHVYYTSYDAKHDCKITMH